MKWALPVLLIVIGVAMITKAWWIDVKPVPKKPLTAQQLKEESEDFVGFLFGGGGAIVLAIYLFISTSG